MVPMAKSLFRVLIVGLGLCCWLAGNAPAQDQKVLKAREKLKESRTTLDAARDNLETTYLELKNEFDRIGGPYTLQFLGGLDAAWLPLHPQFQQRWNEEKSSAKQYTRRRFEDYVAPVLIETAHTQVLDLDPRLLAPFISQCASFFHEALRKERPVEPGDIEVELSEVLVPDLLFYHFWNEVLFTQIVEAREFARANEDFNLSRTELDRVEHPEKYTSKGKLAPSRMVYIPSGKYGIGPNTGWERGRRRVTLREFYMDKYEITNQEYRDFLKSQPPEQYNLLVPYFWPLNQNMERTYPKDRANHPVMGVSWEAAHRYAQWCGKRLPSEDEWEIAARGKEARTYPWGDRFEEIRANTREAGFNQTVEVGALSGGTSPFGCMEMAGNVWEWTATDQDGTTIDEKGENVRNMVIRGGDYLEGADHARSDFRWMTPMDPYLGRHPSKKRIGFRCVKEVD